MIDHLGKQELLFDTLYYLASSALTAFGVIFGLFLWRNSGRQYPRKAQYRVYSLNKRKILPGNYPQELTLSVIIPAYKEESRIGPMLVDTLSYLETRSKKDPKFTSEIIVVDDGSPDETSAQVHKIFGQVKPKLVHVGLIRFPLNQGKGAAISEGILAAKGGHILFADADGATRIKEIEKMEEKRLSTGIDGLFCGSRCLQDDRCTVERHPLRKFLMLIFKQFVGLWGVKSVKDTQCGFKLMSRHAARAIIPNLRLNRWIFDVELIYLAECLEVHTHEVPVSWVEVDGSKLCLATDSVRMAADLILMRLAYALRIWTIHRPKEKADA